jgi:two-component system sensor histidine kinase KdpD
LQTGAFTPYIPFVTDARPNADELLAAIQREEKRSARGRLKVFLGMCPGVGKTFAMLEAARREKAAGRDIVIGYVETHGRKETDALTEGLPLVPRKQSDYRGIQLEEMDLDAVLARRPQLALVDEFAHTNAPGTRHPKRFQDVMELLDAGIDVFTTLNIQHVESRAEAVSQITGVTIHEMVPDTALEGAELELVDLPPDELRARLAAGKVYLADRVRAAQDHFFRPGNLAALRELALRFAAERVGQNVLEYRHALGITDPWKSGQRLLVALSPSPTSAALLRWTRRLSGELHAAWMAVYVEPPRPLEEEDRNRLSRHLALARELGAQVITTSDDDVVRGLLRVAREQNVTQLVVGKPAGWRMLDLFRGGSVLNRLIRESGQIDVHVVRSEGETPAPRPRPQIRFRITDVRGYAIATGAVAAVTVLNLILQRWLGYLPISLLYLVSVIVLGVFVGPGPTLAAATLTALSWNFFFAEPRFTLWLTTATDRIMFLTYFVVALAMGHLTARLRAQQTAERQREQRATALYLLTRELAKGTDLADLLAIVIRETSKTFRAEVALSLPEETNQGALTPYFASSWQLPEKEQSVATWAYQHRQNAGQGTDTLPSAEGLHIPLPAGERVAGVLSLRFRDSGPLAPAQRDLLEAVVPQIAVVLDRQRLRDEERKAELAVESERLSKTLLSSVSHELKTPLAALQGVAESLESGSEGRAAALAEFRPALDRLNRVVNNLLNMTRLEAGSVQPRLDWCDVTELCSAALDLTAKVLARHRVVRDIAPGLPLVKLDQALIEQALGNLLLNGAMHTPPGTEITLRARLKDKRLELSVLDRGPGLPEGEVETLFAKFTRGSSAPTGGSGLGLAIVRGFARAHGGDATARQREGGGAEFTLILPVEILKEDTHEISAVHSAHR